MIIGLKKYNDPDAYFSQENNAIEKILSTLECPTRLETCGPTAVVSTMAAMGKDISIKIGKFCPQPEDLLTIWFNDFRNYRKMRDLYSYLDPARYCGNEVLEWYPLAIMEIFDIKAKFFYKVDAESIVRALVDNIGTVVCLRDPGHYISIVAFDTTRGIFIYNDPWKNNPWPSRTGNGFNREIDAIRLTSNLKPMRLEIF